MRNSEHGVNLLGTPHSAFRNPQFALMGFASDLRILYHLALKPVRGKDHAARMENFYSGQAAAYDDFSKRLLKPGGIIGVVDFYVSRKYAGGSLARHGWFTRNFWPIWFALDNVFPSPDHVPFLHRHFDALHFQEHRARVPYIPLARVPYYLF